ncbi:hypothetical protein M422DRAFT_55612 [Sphaerobolus stellatus SS14]|uniref:Unplaced genomic scaffold SPHSTscaffold_303, whole genome shotgun sequence n=1 Tax=Sphaerobolus stellatus (strain SS14) TaxID=990650 RepID=A0A0C9TAT0_SPHS4|nr:hypothetical protein M422DRAFT_55612 [Sphaerobolus stellatus SS14]
MSDAAVPSSVQTDNATSPGLSATPLPSSSEALTLAHIDDFDFYASENDDTPLIIKGSLTEDASANNLCGRQLRKCPSPVEKVTQGGASSKKRTSDGTKARLSAKRARITVILSGDEAENIMSGEEENPEDTYQKILDSHEAVRLPKKKGQTDRADDCWTVFIPKYEGRKRVGATCNICQT